MGIRKVEENNFINKNLGATNFIYSKKIPKHLTPIPRLNLNGIIGREKDIAKLNTLLLSSNRVVLVNGLGGIGKTTLAQAFITKMEHYYTYVIWLGVIDNIEEAFVFNTILIENLGLNFDYLPKDEQFLSKAFSLITNRLAQLQGNNLLIIDNVNSDISDTQIIQQITLDNNWNIIITSRQKIKGFYTYQLGFLSKRNAIQLFNLHYQIEKNNKIVRTIVSIVDRHTLAIEVIAKTAQVQQLKLSDLLKKLDRIGLKIMDNDSFIQFPRAYNQRMKKVYAFLLDIFDLASLNNYEKWLLRQFAILPSLHIAYQNKNGENIQNLLEIKKHEEEIIFTDALNAVVNKGWLLWNKTKDEFRMHQVLQEVIRHKLNPTLENCHRLVSGCLHYTKEKYDQNPSEILHFTPFPKSILNHLSGASENLAILTTLTGVLVNDQGNYNEAIEYYLNAISRYKELSLQEGIELLSPYGNITEAFRRKGDLKQALYFAEQAIELATRLLGDHHYQTAIAYDNLAVVLHHTGQYQNALNLQLKAIKILEQVPDKQDRHLIRIYNNLGETYKYLYQYKEALYFHQKALDIRKKSLAETHPSLANSYNNLANIYFYTGEIELSIEHHQKAIKIREIILPKNHPDLGFSYDNIAMAYKKQGDYKNALHFQEKAVTIIQDNFGVFHQDTAIAFNSLANTNYYLKIYSKAFIFHFRALRIRLKLFGLEHPDTANSYGNLAYVYYATAQFQLAKKSVQKALYIFESLQLTQSFEYNNLMDLYQEIDQLK